MRHTVRTLPLFAILLAFTGISCTTTTNTTVVSSITPTITSFSPDTAWTFSTVTIYGSNFGYDPANIRVTLDTVQLDVQSVDDTILTVQLPEAAANGFIHVRAYEQTATSSKPLAIKYTFYPHSFTDTVPPGGSFSIPGTGMNNYHGFLKISLNGTLLPVDSIFPDRIVSHAMPNSYTGAIFISDSGYEDNVGSLFVTRPSSWHTLSEIWDNITIQETHSRVYYINGSAVSDTSWITHASYAGQRDTNITGIPFEKLVNGLAYNVPMQPPYAGSYLAQLTWDTIDQTMTGYFRQFSANAPNPFLSVDTQWYGVCQALSVPLPVDADIEVVMPNLTYSITADSTDANRQVVWHETVNTTMESGAFDLIFKQ